jgi:hypothetical protein
VVVETVEGARWVLVVEVPATMAEEHLAETVPGWEEDGY